MLTNLFLQNFNISFSYFALKVSDDHSQSSEPNRPSLRKALSLPPDTIRKKIEPAAKSLSPEETIASLESKLEDMKKTKDMLEDERVGLLDTICKQDQQVLIRSY